MKKIFKKLFCKTKPNISSGSKFIKSVIAVGDIIEAEYLEGKKDIYKIEKFEVILNNPHFRPIDFVIRVRLSYDNGISSIECTSDKFKYIKHISHAEI